MTTVTQVETILSSGNTGVDSLQDDPAIWNYLLPSRNILYYTFDASPGSYIDSKTSASVTAFNETQKAAAREILDYASGLIGVTFAEVDSSDLADAHFGASNLAGSTVSGLTSSSWGYTYTGAETLTSLYADVIVYLDNVEFFSDNNLPTAGTSGYQVLLHEIGHLLGLGHPFEGAPLLPAAQDNTDNTVMSYTWTGSDKFEFQSFDLLALEWIYGGDGIGGTWGYNSTNGPSLSPSDTMAPTVLDFSPLDEATGVAVGSNIVLTFSEDIQRGTGNIVLKTTAGVTVATYNAATSANLSISGSTLTLNPSADLAAGTSYQVEFAAGSIKDLAGNSFAGTTSYNFSTAAASSGGTTPVFIAYDTATFSPGDLLGYLLSSANGSGVQFSAASLIGAPAQVSMFDSLNLSPSLQLGKGVLLTSGDGTPPTSSTSSSYGVSQNGQGDEAMSAIALQAFSGAGETNDACILEFTATVTDASVTTLAIDLIFGSDEYPEYADSSYVDIAAAIVNGANYGLFSNGSPLSITSVNDAYNNVSANQNLPIEYDGLSGRLTVLLPVSLGVNQIRLGVADTGDYIYDSGLFLSNLRALSGTNSTGVKLEIVAPPNGGVVSSSSPTQDIAEIFYGSAFNDTIIAGAGDDFANSSGGNDTFDMGSGNDYAQGGSGDDTLMGGSGDDILEGGGGSDTFQGSVSDFNGDTLNDFQAADKLLFTAVNLTPSNFVFTTSNAAANASSAAGAGFTAAATLATQTQVGVDANNDGMVESSFVLKGSYSAANFSVTTTGGNTVVTLAAAIPVNPTTAKIYLGLNDSITLSNSGATLYGGTGADVVTLGAEVSAVVLDQNIDRVQLPGVSGSYTFKQAGNQINVYDASGVNLLARLPVQGDADGTLLSFSDGTASAKLAAGVMTVGGASVNSVTPAALSPTLSSNPSAPTAPSSAKVYLGQNDSFTLNNSGLTVYGGTGVDQITLAQGVSATVLDQNVDEVVFQQASGNYAFKQAGNQINVYDASGATLLTRLPVQGDADGTLLTFSDGTASAKLAAGVMTLGLATVGATTATTLQIFGASAVSITGTGSSDAASADQTYTLALGSYTHTISGFDTGDKLDFPAGSEVSVSNSSFTDGQVDLTYASSGSNFTIRLTGLASSIDQQLNNPADFDLVFGAGTLF